MKKNMIMNYVNERINKWDNQRNKNSLQKAIKYFYFIIIWINDKIEIIKVNKGI